MSQTGAQLARFALEQLDVGFVLGIPGVHTTELFDELASSARLKPILVTHECGAAFMADAISRTSSRVGTLLVVPGAGLTHAASGIAEAFLDGIPLLVLSGGIDRSSQHSYQLHDIDQQALMAPITKATWRVTSHREVVTTLYKAYREAVRGRPGPVYVELPVDILLYSGEPGLVPEWPGVSHNTPIDQSAIEEACTLIESARRPGIFVGWGARAAQAELTELAELLSAPVATTLQGLSSFPADHPLHAGMSFGEAAVPAARNAFANCDCLIAVGTCFSQIGTGSYSIEVPDSLIHIDIDPEVFSRNYPAQVAIAGDARQALAGLLQALKVRGLPLKNSKLAPQIARDKADYLRSWRQRGNPNRVNPAKLFQAVDRLWPREITVVADDGNHTFLTAELLPMPAGRKFISPTDFNCMGYAVPAAIGAKLADPSREVLAVVGDGAFLMTGIELLTAVSNELGIVVLVFSDGELAQIAQVQEIPYNRKTCTVLRPLDLRGSAQTTGCAFLSIQTDQDIEAVLEQARGIAVKGRPVIVDVQIDYSQRTAFTKGILAVNIKRLPGREKLRAFTRAAVRRIAS